MRIGRLQRLHQLSLFFFFSFFRNLAGESEIPHSFRIFQLSPESLENCSRSPSDGVLESSLQGLA